MDRAPQILSAPSKGAGGTHASPADPAPHAGTSAASPPRRAGPPGLRASGARGRTGPVDRTVFGEAAEAAGPFPCEEPCAKVSRGALPIPAPAAQQSFQHGRASAHLDGLVSGGGGSSIAGIAGGVRGCGGGGVRGGIAGGVRSGIAGGVRGGIAGGVRGCGGGIVGGRGRLHRAALVRMPPCATALQGRDWAIRHASKGGEEERMEDGSRCARLGYCVIRPHRSSLFIGRSMSMARANEVCSQIITPAQTKKGERNEQVLRVLHCARTF
jgi:hypothetical protein